MLLHLSSRGRCLAALGSTFLLFSALPLAAATFTVTNTADAGAGSLRQAIADSEAAAGSDTIVFDAALSGATITVGSQFTIARQVTIDASALAQGITLRGGGSNRLFEAAQGSTLNLRRLKLAGGNPAGGNGGAVLTFGTMQITDCTFQGNAAALGGAIYADTIGLTNIVQSTFFENTAGDSGALWVTGSHAVTMTNCTLTLNRSTNSDGTGAISVVGGQLSLMHCTVAANAGGSFGGGIYTSTSLTVERCIVAANTAVGTDSVDFFKGSGTLTVTGPSLVGSNASVAAEFPAGTLVGTTGSLRDPLLRPLGQTGGATRTLAPLTGSPALDAASGSGVSIDQRGFARSSAAADLGAVERGPIVTVTNANDNGTGSLRAAIAAASTSDTRIRFDPSLNGATITCASGVLTFSGKHLELDASQLAAGLTLAAGSASRIALLSGGSLCLQRITFSGGAPADGFGGGNIIVQDAAFLAVDSTMRGGSAFGGGALLTFRSPIDLHRCTFSGNSATNDSGALSQVGGDIRGIDCAFLENTCTGNGGVTVIFSGCATYDRCTFARNSAGNYGGLFAQGVRLVLTNCTLSGNRSGEGVTNGTLVAFAGQVHVTHTTITENVGGQNAGGIHVQAPAVLRLERSIVAGNRATAGFAPDISKFSGTITAVGGNLIGSNQTVETEFPAGALVGTSAAPLAPLLGPLARTGGFTATHSPRAASVARNAAGASPLATDQRGLPRGVDGASDLGAVERGPNVIVTSGADSGAGTLRAAVEGNFSPDTLITSTVSPVTLSSAIVVLPGKSVDIDAGITIIGGGFAVFGTMGVQRVTLSGVTTGNAAISTAAGGRFLASDCSFTGNSVGGVLCEGTVDLERCSFTENDAVGITPAFFQNTAAAQSRLTNCTFAANRNSAGAGAVNILGGTASLVHVTVTGNSAGAALQAGGGSTVRLERCLVAGNLGGDLSQFGGTITGTGPNLIGNNAGLPAFPAGPLVGTSNAPLDPKVGAPGRTGGLTATCSPLNGSPALNAAGMSPLVTDQRGFARGVGGSSDLGAVERGPVFTVTTVANAGAGSLRDALFQAELSADPRIEFNASLDGQIVPLSSALVVPSGASLQVDASNLPAGLRLDAGGGPRRVLEVAAGATVALYRVTISGASSAAPGGGIRSSGTLLLDSCDLTNNAATEGGALYADAGRATLVGCRVVGNTANTATQLGKAAAASVTATDCWFGSNAPPASFFGAGVVSTPFVTLSALFAVPGIPAGSSTGLAALVYQNSAGQTVPAARYFQLIGRPIAFTNLVRGSISGAPATLQVGGVAFATFTGLEVGVGSVTVNFDGATATTSINISPAPPARLVNVSTRLRAGTGDSVPILGFAIRDGAKRVAVRVLGPTLSQFGVPDVLANPTLELVRSSDGVTLLTNDNWQDNATAAAALTAANLALPNALECGTVQTLDAGNYTAIVRGAGGTSGNCLVEVYDIDTASAPKLVNLSTRGPVGTGDNVMIAGIVIGSGAPRRFLIRSLGPTLTGFGVPSALADPMIEVVANGSTLVTNDDWQSTQAAEITASGFAPPDAREPALILTLAPGSYTAIVRGKNATSGNAIVEVYELP